MTPNHILRKERREREMTLAQMADALETSNQRVSQWEQGDSIPIERIQTWAHEKRFRDWVRSMAQEMWLAAIAQQQEALAEQIESLRQMIPVGSD